MHQADILIVKESFRKVAPIADQAAVLFYARLFELDPSLRPLFRGDIAEQGKKLMSMLGMTVAMLHRIDMVVPHLKDLGVRHAGYGVTEQHYATVGTALLWTLQKGLGPEFTPEVREAWTSAYSLIANTMIGAAREAEAATIAA
jgi:hemoglobin-like flavoprotein